MGQKKFLGGAGKAQQAGGRLEGYQGDSYVLLARWDDRGRVASESIHVFGSATAEADVDQDGTQEVFAGNTLYAADGSVRWSYAFPSSNSACGGRLPCDGFNGIGNFDGHDVFLLKKWLPGNG